jgi:hypothetical protein
MPSGNQLVDASAARVTTGTGNAVATADSARISWYVNVTATSGSPNMVLSVEWSHDGSTWATADSADTMTAITSTANGTLVKSFPVRAPFARLRWTITGGTPSLTFSTRAHLADA